MFDLEATPRQNYELTCFEFKLELSLQLANVVTCPFVSGIRPHLTVVGYNLNTSNALILPKMC